MKIYYTNFRKKKIKEVNKLPFQSGIADGRIENRVMIAYQFIDMNFVLISLNHCVELTYFKLLK